MAFTEHKITAFQHRIADLPDQPNLPSNELKARFDSAPEELRQSLNAVCDDAARLDARVAGIIAETFGDVIPETMLAPELAGKINAKADETSVAERLAAETKTRADADTALESRLQSKINSAQTTANGRARIAYGEYTGNGTDPQQIRISLLARAVIVASDDSSTTYMVLQGCKICNNSSREIANLQDYTLTVQDRELNQKNYNYHWLALA